MSAIKNEIYFIQDSLSKRIKIGYTTNLKKRFQSLRSANANKLFILGAVPGTVEDEIKLHKKFSEYKVHGEWFHPSDEILDFINGKNENMEQKAIKKKEEEILYSVKDAAKNINLSRARVYQLIKEGFFPKPLYDKRTGRPYYTTILLKEIKKVVRTKIGVNGEICLQLCFKKAHIL